MTSDVKMIIFLEYLKLHIISLEQYSDKLEEIKENFQGDYDSEEYENLVLDDYYNTGELTASRHLLSVAEGILEKTQ